MRELIGLIGAVDDDAAGALRVIAYFDTLVERGASISAFVRGAAAQAGCAAGFADRSRGQVIRADAAGHGLEPVTPEQVSTVEVLDDLGAQVWLEREGLPSVVDAMVLERFAAGVRITLERTRDRDRVGPALRVLLDEQAESEQRRAAADRLGIAGPATVLAAAPLAGGADGLPRGAGRLSTRIGRVHAIVRSGRDASDELAGWRVGIGQEAGPAHLLPASLAVSSGLMIMSTKARRSRQRPQTRSSHSLDLPAPVLGDAAAAAHEPTGRGGEPPARSQHPLRGRGECTEGPEHLEQDREHDAWEDADEHKRRPMWRRNQRRRRTPVDSWSRPVPNAIEAKKMCPTNTGKNQGGSARDSGMPASVPAGLPMSGLRNPHCSQVSTRIATTKTGKDTEDDRTPAPLAPWRRALRVASRSVGDGRGLIGTRFPQTWSKCAGTSGGHARP